jgi:hypothetical protein
MQGVVAEGTMANETKERPNKGEIVALEPRHEIVVLPPKSGVVGRFIAEAENMFKARAMRMRGLLRRINESGHRTEVLLRTAAERMEVAESALERQFRKEGLTRMEDDEPDGENV